MAEYIEKEALLSFIDAATDNSGMGYVVAKTVKRFVKRRPSADVAPVRHGRWVPTEAPFMNECEDCSVCGYRTVWGHRFNYCPNCGCLMDGGDDE